MTPGRCPWSIFCSSDTLPRNPESINSRRNYLDCDADDDGIPDSVEGTTDADGDASPNFLGLFSLLLLYSRYRS